MVKLTENKFNDLGEMQKDDDKEELKRHKLNDVMERRKRLTLGAACVLNSFTQNAFYYQ